MTCAILEGKDRIQSCPLLARRLADDGCGVEQALGEDDGVADRDRLQTAQSAACGSESGRDSVMCCRRGYFRPSASSVLSNSLGAVEKTGLEKSLDDVILSLLNPCTLSAERTDVLGLRCSRRSANYVKRGVLGFFCGTFST